MPKQDLRTQAIVLNRTKYAEADRILNLITPNGRYSVIAKSARKEKSRLAGGIELFCVSDIVIHQGRNQFGILKSAKMIEFYDQILADFNRLDLAAKILKQANKLSNQIDTPDLFLVVKQSLTGINDGLPLNLVEIWFLFQKAKLSGEEINLHLDQSGNPLSTEKNYIWDPIERVLCQNPNGQIDRNAIKCLRLFWASDLNTVSRVLRLSNLLPIIAPVAHSLN